MLQLLELTLGTVIRVVLEACHRDVRTSPAWVHVVEIVHMTVITRYNEHGPLPNVFIVDPVDALVWAVAKPSFYIFVPASWTRRRWRCR